MGENYFKTLFISALSSFITLAFLTALTLRGLAIPPWIPLGCAVIPLAYYHRYLTKHVSHGLSAAAIDSVYYFGFLITVAALGMSAISIAVGGAADSLNTVIYQFGAGLLATGYAVIARMHLTARASVFQAVSSEVLMDRYVQKSMEMVSNVEMAAVRLSDFSQTIMTKTTEVSDTARSTAEKAMIDVARTFQAEMQSTLSLARDGLREIRGMVSDTSFAAEREILTKSVHSTIDAVSGLNRAFEELTISSREGSLALHQSAVSTSRLDEAVVTMQRHVEQFSDEDKGLAKAARAMTQTGENMGQSAALIGHAVHAMADVAATVSDTGPTFKAMATLAKKAHTQLDALGDISSRLEGAVTAMSGAADASQKMATSMAATASAMPALEEVTVSLTEKLHKTGLAAEQLKVAAINLPVRAESVTDLAKALNNSFLQFSKMITSVADQAQKLEDVGAFASRATETNENLRASTDSLITTIDGLQIKLSALGSGAGEIQVSLAKVGEDVRASLRSSTEAMGEDLKRSTAASHMLIESLSNVAKTVVEQTRRQSGLTV